MKKISKKNVNRMKLVEINYLLELTMDKLGLEFSPEYFDIQNFICLCMEHAALENKDRHYEKAGLFLDAALVTAYVFDLSGIGNGFYQKKSKKLDTQSLIVHYALKLSNALIKRKSDDIIDDYYYKLFDITEEYVKLKDNEVSSNVYGQVPLT